jgi:dihydrofolate reductase
MAALIYLTICSLDGYVEDADGRFQWGAPDDEVAAFINDSMRGVGTYLYGRRMYETMQYWETANQNEGDDKIGFEFATMWRAATKVVYSRVLGEATTARTRIEHDFGIEEVRRQKSSADTDLAIGGAELGGQALTAGLVDELHLYLAPLTVGGGKPALPAGLGVALDLRDERRFASGFVHVRYGVSSPSRP